MKAARPLELRLTVTFPDGSPAKDVLVGNIARREKPDPADPKRPRGWDLELAGEGPLPCVATGPDGRVTIPESSLFHSSNPPEHERAVMARSRDGDLFAMMAISRGTLDRDVTLQLAPACRVDLRMTSASLEELGMELTRGFVYIGWRNLRTMGLEDGSLRHDFPLPPGEYKLWIYGKDTIMQILDVVIEPGETRKTLDVDLPASQLARLIGKPAPELQKIKEWKNGGPVTLAELRGKVVLLDFWGEWCGPCVGAMPSLMETYDTYKDKGLVIIAIHDDSVASIKEMDERLAERRKNHWGGRDLPFLVALDGGGRTPMPVGDDAAAGATTAAYGIWEFPTQILIGRDGKVIGKRGKGEKDQLPGLMKE